MRSKLAQIKKAFRLALHAREQGWTHEQLLENIEKVESRRRFIQGSAAALLAASPVASYALKNAKGGKNTPSDPVLILGGGAAGLAAAYTLFKSGVPFQIIEAQTRIGGRIFTRSNYNSQGQFIEYGAELVDVDHKTLMALAKEMDLEIQSLIAADAGLNPEVYYIEGKYHTRADLLAGIDPLLDAVAAAKKDGAEWLDYDEYKGNKAAIKYDRMSAAQFFQSLNGKVAPWILTLMEIEYLAEFGVDLDKLSAICVITDFDTKPKKFKHEATTDECYRVAGGSSQIPLALANAMSANGSNMSSFLMGAQIEAIRQTGSRVVVTITQNGKTTDLSASQVICTLPFTTLRKVAGISKLGLTPQKLDCINNLSYGTNSKVILELNQKPWLDKSAPGGPCGGTIYTDLPSQNFWDCSRGQVGTNGLVTTYVSGTYGAEVGPSTATSESFPNLLQIYPSLAGGLVSSVSVNWSKVPTALGSYSSLTVGQFERFNGAQGTMELNGQLLFAGEHASVEFQGFMEGGYETGIKAGNQILKSRNLKAVTIGS